jgi:hypothetical protein
MNTMKFRIGAPGFGSELPNEIKEQLWKHVEGGEEMECTIAHRGAGKQPRHEEYVYLYIFSAAEIFSEPQSIVKQYVLNCIFQYDKH